MTVDAGPWPCGYTLAAGDSMPIRASVSYGPLSGKEPYSSDQPAKAWRFRWSASDARVGTIGSRGMLTTKSPGSLVVGATNGEAAGDTVFEVVASTLRASVTPARLALAVGDTAWIVATLRDAGDDVVPDRAAGFFYVEPSRPGAFPLNLVSRGGSGGFDSLKVVGNEPGTMWLRWCMAPRVGAVEVEVH